MPSLSVKYFYDIIKRFKDEHQAEESVSISSVLSETSVKKIAMTFLKNKLSCIELDKKINSNVIYWCGYCADLESRGLPACDASEWDTRNGHKGRRRSAK